MTGKHFSFTDTTWSTDRTVLSCRYELQTDEENYTFTETLEFPIAIADTLASQALTMAIHLALGISYYKTTLPPVISHNYRLSQDSANFWNTVYQQGLSELLYVHKLPRNRVATFQATATVNEPQVKDTWQPEEAALLGIGGGKDSIVAGEILRDIAMPTEGFVLASGEQLGQTQAVADVMQLPLHAVKRRLDPLLFTIHKKPGSYNGHVPISLIFALVGCMLAVTKQTKYVVVANEASSSIPQTTWDNLPVNHQWSKSLEFEKLFQAYIHENVSPELEYFSIIRPLSSVAVTKLFSRLPQYFEVFTSDNSLFKIKPETREHPRWSLASSKSLSSYILLSPWLDKATLKTIFGRDFTAEPTLIELGKRLLGKGEPVLDCVGTPAELRASMSAGLASGTLDRESDVIQATLPLLDTPEPLANFSGLETHAFPEIIAAKLMEYFTKHL